MRTQHHERGFTLLEIIIVLAIAGGVLVMYTNHVRKEALRTSQQNIANALVQEMKGVINFIKDDPLPVASGDPIDNPLYTKNASNNDQYNARLENKINDLNTGTASHYFLWGDGNNAQNQQRYLFISSDCNVQLKPTQPELKITKEYLSCQLASSAQNNAAMINRVGFASENLTNPDTSIARVDVIVAFDYTKGNDRYHFFDLAPAFNKSLSNSGLIASHMMLVHRSSDNGDWQLVTKADNKTPIELNNAAANMAALTVLPKTERFGVRFTFDMNDNSNGGGGGGGNADVCWDSENSTVVHCFEQHDGTDDHGQDTVLALVTKKSKDDKDPNNIRPGTLNANLITENTSRKVYIFKREKFGEIETGSDGQPERYTYTGKVKDDSHAGQFKDGETKTFEGDFYVDDVNRGDNLDPGDYSYGGVTSFYVNTTYDAFELVTPAIVDYIGAKEGRSSRDNTDYMQYDDSSTDTSIHGALRYPVQVCPKIKQKIPLRDKSGANKNNAFVEIERQLFPRLSVSISSISAYPGGNSTNSSSEYSGVDLEDPSNNRSGLDQTVPLGQLGGITTQVEIVPQAPEGGNTGQNSGAHYVYPGPNPNHEIDAAPNQAYVWAITNTLGIYDGKTGQGRNIVNSVDVSYTVTRWCSSIPQTGTPGDLIETYKYE